MTEMNFRRQDKPTMITITGGDPIDRQETSRLLYRYLVNQIDLVERHSTPEAEVINLYPRAVND